MASELVPAMTSLARLANSHRALRERSISALQFLFQAAQSFQDLHPESTGSAANSHRMRMYSLFSIAVTLPDYGLVSERLLPDLDAVASAQKSQKRRAKV